MKPVNLNKVRKARDRTAAKQKADENAVRFGQTKAERVLEATRATKAAARLDQLKFEDDG